MEEWLLRRCKVSLQWGAGDGFLTISTRLQSSGFARKGPWKGSIAEIAGFGCGERVVENVCWSLGFSS